MEICADQPAYDRSDDDPVQDPEPRIANPQHGHDRDNPGGVARREGFEAGATMKRVKSVDAVANEGRIVANPGLGPRTAEQKLELVLDRARDDETERAQQRNRF